METILYGLFFITGFLVHASYTYVLGLGYSVVSIKQSLEDSLLILGKAFERIIVMNEVTYKALEQKGLDTKEIEKYRRLDRLDLDTTMDIGINNIIHFVPSRYKDFLNFHDWKTANKEITRIIKERNNS